MPTYPTNTINADATDGQLQVIQTLTAAPFTLLTTGVIVPMYIGSGPPATPANLVTGAAYSLYCLYLDISTPLAPNLWICTTAGSSTTSTWYSFTQC